MIGINNEPIDVASAFIEDQGITFPVLHDNAGVYSRYNIPGAASPYPRDFIFDENGIIHLAKTEYEPGTMISIIEGLLGGTSVDGQDEREQLPLSDQLLTVFPNPFNPNVQIEFQLERGSEVSLSLMDVKGRTVLILVENEWFEAGQYSHGLEANELPSGIYFFRLEYEGQRLTKKIVKLR